MVFGQNVVNIVISAQDKFSGAFKKAGLSMQSFKKAALGMGIVGGAIAFGMSKAVTAANEVETGLARVNTLLDKGQDAERLFGDFVAEANIKLGNQGDQLSALDGLYQTISAGIIDVAEAQMVMDAAIVATVGGMANQESVINALTKTMAAFGLEAKDAASITDKFAGTVKAGQTTMEGLASAFPTVAGLAGEAGITLDETLGTFAGLTKFMGSSEEATTSLSAVIRGFIKPTTDMKNAVEALGFESASAMIKEIGLNKSVKLLSDSVGGNIEVMGKLFPNVRALKAILPLTGKAAEAVADSIDIVTNSAGLAQKQANDVADTMQYRWGQATSELQNLQIGFGKQIKESFTPILEGLVKVIGWLANAWKNLSPQMKNLIVVFLAISAALLLIAGAIALIILVSSPWLLIIFAIAAAIALLIVFWDDVVNFVQKGIIILVLAFLVLRDTLIIVWEVIKNAAIIAWNSIVSVIQGAINGILFGINTLIKGINLIPGINIPLIPKLDLSGIQGELTDIGELRARLASERIEKIADLTQRAGIEVNIENVNGADPDAVAQALQDMLDNKIST